MSDTTQLHTVICDVTVWLLGLHDYDVSDKYIYIFDIHIFQIILRILECFHFEIGSEIESKSEIESEIESEIKSKIESETETQN